MHPYWIQKIEEARQTSVNKFWITILLVIVIPVFLILKPQQYIFVAILCFVGAGLRIIWTGKLEAEEAERQRLQEEARQQDMLEQQAQSMMQAGITPAFAPAQWASTQAHPFPGPQFPNGVQTTPEFSTSAGGMGVQTDVDYSTGRQGGYSVNSPFETGVQGIQTTPDFATSRGYSQMAPAEGLFAYGAAEQIQIHPDYVPPAMVPEQEPQQPAHRARPGRPLHFHDMAR